jgi:hypothetical protein
MIGTKEIVGMHWMTSRRNQNVGLAVIFSVDTLLGEMNLV